MADATEGRARAAGGRALEEAYAKLLIEARDRSPLSRRDAAGWFELRHNYSFGCPTPAALDLLQEAAPIVEIGAGGGYWAYLLRERGVDIVAYDLHPPPCEENWYAKKLWTEVLTGGHVRAADHPDHTLFLCWPAYGERWAEEALVLFQGSRVAYAGEYAGGCCATDEFFSTFEQRFPVLEADFALPSEWGIHDSFVLRSRG